MYFNVMPLCKFSCLPTSMLCCLQLVCIIPPSKSKCCSTYSQAMWNRKQQIMQLTYSPLPYFCKTSIHTRTLTEANFIKLMFLEYMTLPNKFFRIADARHDPDNLFFIFLPWRLELIVVILLFFLKTDKFVTAIQIFKIKHWLTTYRC